MSLGFHYVRGEQDIVEVDVAAASADIKYGDMITVASGLASRCGDGDAVKGIAVEAVSSPDADGGVRVKIDCGKTAVYRYVISAGSVALTNQFTTADAGAYGDSGSTVKVASPANNDLYIIDFDAAGNSFDVRLA